MNRKSKLYNTRNEAITIKPFEWIIIFVSAKIDKRRNNIIYNTEIIHSTEKAKIFMCCTENFTL